MDKQSAVCSSNGKVLDTEKDQTPNRCKNMDELPKHGAKPDTKDYM